MAFNVLLGFAFIFRGDFLRRTVSSTERGITNGFFVWIMLRIFLGLDCAGEWVWDSVDSDGKISGFFSF